VMMNMSGTDQIFEIPGVPGRRWHRVVDTSLPSPQDIIPLAETQPLSGTECTVASHSIHVIVSQ